MAKRNVTKSVLNKLKSRPEKRTPIASNMFLPNHSGDHSKGRVRETPTQNTDIPNKNYVDTQDSNIVGTYLDNHPHQNVNTNADVEFNEEIKLNSESVI